MKKMKWLAMLMVTIMVAGCLAGCGKSKQQGEYENNATNIEISYWNSGLGTKWLDKVIEGFEKKYPEYNVYYNATASTEAATAAYGVADSDTVDIYMVTEKYDTENLEPLNDVLDTTVEGESKSIKEKFNPGYLALEEVDGNYYTLTYGGGLIGFVYNVKMFEKAGISQLPRTTDEFSYTCSKLYDQGITPLCHFQTIGYYHFLSEAWFAQYDGIDYFYDFYKNPTKEKMLVEDGRYETMKVYEKFITPEYVLPGSNSTNHVSMQTKFLQESCAMMLTGSWLSNEMLNSDKVNDFVMMKTPVISSITDKLDTVDSEKTLREIITAIDNVTDGIESIDTYKDGDNYSVNGESISAKDWDYIKSARNTMPGNFAAESLYIPKYSNAKEGAKEFLKYLYSDEGYRLYLEALCIPMPLSLDSGEIDTTNWNAFSKSQAELIAKTEYTISNAIKSRDRIYTDGGVGSAFTGDTFVNLMCSNNEADRITALKTWENLKLLVEEEYDKWISNIK